MNWRTIPPLIRKDLTIFFRNRFYAFISIFALAAYTGFYYLMPQQVDEVIEVGLHVPASAADAEQLLGADGLYFRRFASLAEMQRAVEDRQITAGIAFPENLTADLRAGKKPTLDIYVLSDLDRNTREAMQIAVEALSLGMTGQTLNIETNDILLGRDMAGMQVPPRDRILPLFILVLLMFETMGLASLLAEEIQTGTIRALLVSPMSAADLFFAKGLVSVGLVMFQAVVITTATGALFAAPLLLLVTLLLGALLVTAIGFLIGAAGKDMLSVMSWGVLVLVLLGIPAFGVLFPGMLTGWSRLPPSHYLADTIHQVINFGASWQQVYNNLLILLAWNAALLLAGVLVLKRKFT
ncbi:MAG: ABC transporter permease [Chloroflexota bacterium]